MKLWLCAFIRYSTVIKTIAILCKLSFILLKWFRKAYDQLMLSFMIHNGHQFSFWLRRSAFQVSTANSGSKKKVFLLQHKVLDCIFDVGHYFCRIAQGGKASKSDLLIISERDQKTSGIATIYHWAHIYLKKYLRICWTF